MRGVSNLDKEWLHGTVISPCKIQEQCERRTVENNCRLSKPTSSIGRAIFHSRLNVVGGVEQKRKRKRDEQASDEKDAKPGTRAQMISSTTNVEQEKAISREFRF